MELMLIVCAWAVSGYAGGRIWMWNERQEYPWASEGHDYNDADRVMALVLALLGPVGLITAGLMSIRRWYPRWAMFNPLPLIRRIFP